MEKKNINIYGHWRTFSDRILSFKNLFGKKLKCCVDKHLGFKLEELGTGMFVDKICYKYRTRNKGEKSIVHAYSLKRIKSEVIKEAEKRRKNNNVYPILKNK